MIYTGYVKVAPGKPLTGLEKLRISPGREDKFSLGEGKNPLGRGFTGCGTEGCSYGKQKRLHVCQPQL